tara:strand:- start:8245 stop:8433 length:189 start_codon:yes stop_codon:yes gene_type:complete
MDTKKLIKELKNKGFSPLDSMKKIEREARAEEFIKANYGPAHNDIKKGLKEILLNFQIFNNL